MEHRLFTSVDEMLDPDTLSALGTVLVRNVRCVPVHQNEAYSGSSFYLVETNDRIGPRYILKRIPAAKDLAVPYSDLNRSMTTWQHGLLDRLTSDIVHAVVACSYDDAGYAILMDDMSGALMPGDKPFTLADHVRFLDTMAAMHAEFWDDPRLRDTNLGSPPYFYTSSTSGAEGWACVEQFLEPDVAMVVRSLLRNPRPLYDALLPYPLTLVHNDLWWANLGITRDQHSRVVMLDWDFATIAPPAVDLAFYIGENTGFLPVSNEVVIDGYRDCLERHLGDRFDERWWLPQLDLSLLGCFLRRGKWILLASARATDDQERTQYRDELAWWSNYIRRAARQL